MRASSLVLTKNRGGRKLRLAQPGPRMESKVSKLGGAAPPVQESESLADHGYPHRTNLNLGYTSSHTLITRHVKRPSAPRRTLCLETRLWPTVRYHVSESWRWGLSHGKPAPQPPRDERGRYGSERLESDSGNAICSFTYPSDPNILVEGGSIGGR